MKHEKRKTFTYYGTPTVNRKAAAKARKNGKTLSEVIDAYLAKYSKPVKIARIEN